MSKQAETEHSVTSSYKRDMGSSLIFHDPEEVVEISIIQFPNYPQGPSLVDPIQLPQLLVPHLAQFSPSQGAGDLALWHHLPFSGLIGIGTAVELVPVDVLGLEVVRIWEVVEGSGVTVLLLISVFCETVIVPGMQGEKTR